MELKLFLTSRTSEGGQQRESPTLGEYFYSTAGHPGMGSSSQAFFYTHEETYHCFVGSAGGGSVGACFIFRFLGFCK